MWKKWTAAAVLIATTALFLDVGVYLFYPDVSRLKRARPAGTSFMAYRQRQWARMGKPRKIIQRWVPLAQISPYAVKAAIIAEDDKFWSHEGFDFEAIEKAFEKDIKRKRFKAGGSTISQQLAKNLYLTPAKNPVRKLKEAILTWRLERNLSKRRIIELYLNVVEWGNGIFGIEAASRHYFGKSAAELTAREAALLAAVLPNPLRYNPVGGGRYVEARSGAIFRIMVRRGIVIPEYEELMEEPPAPEAEEGAAPSAEMPADGSGSAGPAEGEGETLEATPNAALPGESGAAAGAGP